MTDIVERLRYAINPEATEWVALDFLIGEAITEIERLRVMLAMIDEAKNGQDRSFREIKQEIKSANG